MLNLEGYTQVITITVWVSGIPHEIEANPVNIRYEKGKLIINDKSYEIVIESTGNKIKRYESNWGDGLPRIITSWRGFENVWELDEVILTATK